MDSPTTASTEATHQVLVSSPNPETPHPKRARKSPETLCDLCRETQETEKMFTVKSCKHSFCSGCLSKHVKSKIDEGKHVVSCRGFDCEEIIELEACSSMLPKSLVEKWNELLFEALMREQQWQRCPKRTSCVEKTHGCVHIECRCDFQFCYKCGKEWSEQHAFTCQNNDEFFNGPILVSPLTLTEWDEEEEDLTLGLFG